MVVALCIALSNCHGGHRANAQNYPAENKSANQVGFLPKGLTPSVDGRPNFLRRSESDRPISRAPRQRFSGRLLGERSGSWWKTIGVQSAYRPAVLEWERASDPRSPLEPGVLCGGAPDFHGMLFGLLHGRRSPLAPPAR